MPKKKLTVCLRFLASRGVTWLHSLPPDVCHDVFTCVTWLIHMHDMTRSCVWHDSLICHARYFDSFALRVVLISTLTHTRTHILCRALSLPFSLSKSLSLSLSLSTSLSPSFFLSPSLSFSLPLSFLQTHLSSHLILTWPLHFFHLFSFFFVHSSSVFFKRSQDQVYFPPCILGVCVCVCVRTHTHTHTHRCMSDPPRSFSFPPHASYIAGGEGVREGWRGILLILDQSLSWALLWVNMSSVCCYLTLSVSDLKIENCFLETLHITEASSSDTFWRYLFCMWMLFFFFACACQHLTWPLFHDSQFQCFFLGEKGLARLKDAVDHFTGQFLT